MCQISFSTAKIRKNLGILYYFCVMKRYQIIFIAFAFCLLAQARLPNKVWGLTLGVSTEAQVKAVCKAKGLKLIAPVDTASQLNYESSKGFYFGGLLWKSIDFSFKRNKLSSIGFDMESNRSLDKESSNFLNLRIKKFPGYYLGPDENSICRFADDDTLVMFWFGDFAGVFFRSLYLCDIKNFE